MTTAITHTYARNRSPKVRAAAATTTTIATTIATAAATATATANATTTVSSVTGARKPDPSSEGGSVAAARMTSSTAVPSYRVDLAFKVVTRARGLALDNAMQVRINRSVTRAVLKNKQWMHVHFLLKDLYTQNLLTYLAQRV